MNNGIRDACSTAVCCPLLSIVAELQHKEKQQHMSERNHNPDLSLCLSFVTSYVWDKGCNVTVWMLFLADDDDKK